MSEETNTSPVTKNHEGRAPKEVSHQPTLRVLIVVGFLCFVVSLFIPREYSPRANPAPVEEDIHSIELACTALLNDAGQPDLFGLFNDVAAMREAYGSYQTMWNTVMPDLLRNGKNAKCDLKPEVRERLGSSYLVDLGRDPWGNSYQFLAGPLTKYGNEQSLYWVRCYRAPNRPSHTDRNGATQAEYYYDETAKAEADADRPGNPKADGLPGFPAPVDLKVYVWSMGQDLWSCQRIELDLSPENVNIDPSSKPYGDDINNWDSEKGWMVFY